MAVVDSRIFFQKLQESQLPNLVLIFGDEPLLVEQALNFAKSRLPEDETWRMMNLQTVYAEDLSEDSLDALFDLPFFAELRCTIIKQVENLKEKVAENLTQRLQSGPSECKFILVAGSMDKKKRVTKSLLEKSVATEFSTPYPNQVRGYVDHFCQKLGVRCEPDVLSLMMERLGTSLSVLHRELEKIKLTFGDRRVSVADLDDFLSYQNEGHIFAAIKSFFQRDAMKFMEFTHKGASETGDALGLLTLLARQTRQLLNFHYHLDHGAEGRALAAKVGLPDFLLREYHAYLPKWTTTQLYDLLTGLSEMDAKFKSTPTDRPLLWTQFTLHHLLMAKI